ncbi:MAG: DUF4932 domain-containing protein [Bryobacteraceae bacterium]|jgi:hypothetical protein
MPRRVAATVLLLLLLPAFAARAQAWRAGVDPRVELMSILFRLAGNPEYNQCRIPAYDKAIETWFAPYRDHQAVKLAHGLDIGFESPMKLAVYVTDADSLAERVPFDAPGFHLCQGWDAAKVRAFLNAARAFVVDSKFKEFLTSQQPLYQATNVRVRAFVETKADLPWFSRFFGSSTLGRFAILPGLANGSPSYAVRFVGPGGAEVIYAIPGVWTLDAAGLPLFNADWRSTVVHQFVRSYCGPLVDKFAPGMEKSARRIYASVGDAALPHSSGNWKMVLDESLVRAVAVRYTIDHDGAAAARNLVRAESAHSFVWVGDLSNLLGQYEKDRQHYPTLESFMPRVAQFFDDLAPRMPAPK